jgi:hypothetical protein
MQEQQLVEPVIVTESDAHYDRGVLEYREVGRPRLEGFGISCRRNDGFDLGEIAGHRLCKACEIAGRSDYADSRSGRGLRYERRAEETQKNDKGARPESSVRPAPI